MKRLAFAAGAAALLSLGAIAVPAQAHGYQDYSRGPVIVTPASPAPRGFVVSPGYRQGYIEPSPRANERDTRWDRDGDGIPNRYDRDRDGDGVPNRYDRRPNNPYRY